MVIQHQVQIALLAPYTWVQIAPAFILIVHNSSVNHCSSYLLNFSRDFLSLPALKLRHKLCTTHKPPGDRRGCRSKAHCQKHNRASTHLVRQWVNWFPFTLLRYKNLKKNTHPDTLRRFAATSQLVPTTQAGKIKNTKVGGARWHARPIHQSFTPIHGLLT